MSWARQTFAALAVRDFRVLWIGGTLGFVAFFTSTVVQAVVAFELTQQNRAVGSVVFAQGVAMFTFSPIGGAIADRISKRLILVFCQIVTMTVFFTLGTLLATDLLRIWALAAGSFLIGSTFAFLGPTRQAYVVDLVPEATRGNAVALNQVALNASRVLGPALAGGLLAWSLFQATGAYFTMAVLYLGSLCSVLLLPPSKPKKAQRSVLADVLAGLSYVRSERALRTVALFFFLVIMLGFPYITVLPGLVENQLHEDAESISLLHGVAAFGGLCASLLVAPLADSRHVLLLYSSAAFAFGATLLLTGLSPSLWTAAAAMFFVGVSSGMFQTLNGAVLIRQTDPMYMGRVMSLVTLAFAGFGLMGLPIGYLADFAGERVTLMVMGVFVCGVSVVFGTALHHRLGQPRAQP